MKAFAHCAQQGVNGPADLCLQWLLLEEVASMCWLLQSAYRHLQRNGAFDEVRFIVKRAKAHAKVIPLMRSAQHALHWDVHAWMYP